MNQQKIFEICASHRQTGSTTWLLFSAVRFPKCILVFYNRKYAEETEQRYNEILRQVGIRRNDPRRGYPIFTSVESNFHGLGDLPIIFDNSCLF